MQPELSSTHEITCRLPRHRSTVPRARALLKAVLGGRHIDQDSLDTTELVLSELVTNALRARAPHDRQVGVRIVHWEEDGLLRLEVSDAGEGRPEMQSPGEDETDGRGLLLVEALAHRWGVQERVGGIGKTVWAELKAPGIGAVPVEREIAAVALQPRDVVKLRGAWRTVRGVRGERSPSGGFVMALVLDDGLVVRVDAAEPLTVRSAGRNGHCGVAGHRET
ncbi:ATP-binding protein [Streptomyces sp. KM273126]|uniref:ATP-binding protein n=1 Tax=Streptomyces sp. KM273126 TaxID=2545247 RepID=UPI00103E781A|nr:ATP-binding protein [Streptomyces sp. KM273126]MBA2809403.1 ATP-binding protein [Streptomyces sp. KM273126]